MVGTQQDDDDRRLRQRTGWFGSMELVLLEDKIQCRLRSAGKRNEFAVPLREIDPDPMRVRNRPWIAYAWGVFFLLGIAAGFYYESTLPRRNTGQGAALGIVSGLFGFGLLFYAVRQTVDVFVFRTSRGNLVVAASKPSIDKTQAFIRQLHDAVTSAQSIELHVTRALINSMHAEGFLDKWQFEKAMERYCRPDR